MKSNILVVLLSVVLSIAANMAFDSYRSRVRGRSDNADVVRAKRFELVDEKGKVRSTLRLVQLEGHAQPQLVFRDESGLDSVVLSLDLRGDGTLLFNSGPFEGKVSVGYLELGDVPDSTDNLPGWGMVVRGPDALHSTALGIMNSGELLQPAR
jgi:hypothetical protein